MAEQKEENLKVSKKHIELQVSHDSETQKLRDAGNKLKAAEERC